MAQGIRLRHPQRGDRPVPGRRGPRPPRPSRPCSTTMPTPGEPGPARLPEAGKSVQGVVVHTPTGKNSPLKVWDVHHRDRRLPRGRPGHDPAAAGLRVNFRYQVQAPGQRTARSAEGGARRQSRWSSCAGQLRTPGDGRRPGRRLSAYFICGRWMFSAASRPVLRPWSAGAPTSWPWPAAPCQAPVRPARLPGRGAGGDLLAVLPHKLARGYSNPQGNVLESVNGIAIRNLRHWSPCSGTHDEFIVIHCGRHRRRGPGLPAQELLDSTNDVLTRTASRSRPAPSC